jgi:hypothetical protein
VRLWQLYSFKIRKGEIQIVPGKARVSLSGVEIYKLTEL